MDHIAELIDELTEEIERIKERLDWLDYRAEQCCQDLELDALEGIAEEEGSLEEDLRIYTGMLERAKAKRLATDACP